jgi:hypothetical protein
MNESISNWQMRGRVFVWRYPRVRTSHQGWHFSAEPTACDALVELLTYMRSAAEPIHRTIKLSRPTSLISSVPGYGDPKNDDFEKLRIMFDPSFCDLQMQLADDRLELCVGDERCNDMLVALTDVQNGKGDFAFGPNQEGASPPIWFWWMPWSGQCYAR